MKIKLHLFILMGAISVYALDNTHETNNTDETRARSELIEYVKNKYEQSLHGIEYLLYPAQNPRRLFILFNGATVGKYTMWSWFWRADESWDDTAYLFLKDDDIRWYLGSEDNSKVGAYRDIINHVIQSLGLTNSQVCTIGHSMGGYAALYYGLQLHVGCIYVFRPQVTWQAAALHYSVKKLRNIWIDLDLLVRRHETVPRLYMQYGEFLPDTIAAHAFIDAYTEKQGIMIIEHTNHPEHLGYYPTQKQIESTVQFLMDY